MSRTAPLAEADGTFEVSAVEGAERKLGRYELIYEIGRGGMANVFLARARGPAGFQKWFAIKRIHGFLAKDTDFVDMFLDEARIAASLHHPNVAQVFDLGEVNGRYFLAMEYLHGEPLSEVAKASLLRGGGPLSPELGAWIVARAAEGLHHAHEACDANGQPMKLVHRDVTPHNVFVTYDGQVKLTDFGVAKAENRLTHTESGMVKGKIAYASPEQLRAADDLDRRTDIFALGIVLWEITVGRRLFRAGNDVQTIQRIADGYRVDPRSVVEGYPDALAAICERALAHDRDERYGSAADMARDLATFLRTSEIDVDGVSSRMRSLFADRIVVKDSVLRDPPFASPAGPEASPAETNPPGGAPPRGELALSQARPKPGGVRPFDYRLASRALRSGRSASRGGPAPPEEKSSRPPERVDGGRRTSGWVRGLAATALLLALAGLATLWASAPGTTLVRIDSSPAGARVELDGRAIDGVTPLVVEGVARGSHRVALSRDGHATHEASFEADGERTSLSYQLGPAEPLPDPDSSIQAPTPEPEPVEPRRSAPEPLEEPLRAARGGSATLTLITRPWARVWVNGRELGETPLMQRRIPAGTVRVRMRPQGTGPDRHLTLEARPGEHVSRNVDL